MHIQNGISEALTVSISINAQLFFSIFMLLLQGMGFGWFGVFFLHLYVNSAFKISFYPNCLHGDKV